MVDDQEDQCRQIKELLETDTFPNEQITVDTKNFLDLKDISSIEKENYDLIVLDLYDEGSKEYKGEELLKSIQARVFIPIIFYTGFGKKLKEKESEIIKIVNKPEGYEGIKKAIDKILESRIPQIKTRMSDYLRDKFREYMWDFVHQDWDKITPYLEGASASYLLTKRLTHALSERYILDMLGEEGKKVVEKKHPLEHYVYPPLSKEITLGDIISKEGKNFIVLTPSCDFVIRPGRERKAENILLAELVDLTSIKAYTEYLSNNNQKDKIKRIIENRDEERYFFLPETWFIKHSLIDFQRLISVSFKELSDFIKISELDSLHTSSVLSRFIRYYNRIGTKDLDSEEILNKIKSIRESVTSQ